MPHSHRVSRLFACRIQHCFSSFVWDSPACVHGLSSSSSSRSYTHGECLDNCLLCFNLISQQQREREPAWETRKSRIKWDNLCYAFCSLQSIEHFLSRQPAKAPCRNSHVIFHSKVPFTEKYSYRSLDVVPVFVWAPTRWVWVLLCNNSMYLDIRTLDICERKRKITNHANFVLRLFIIRQWVSRVGVHTKPDKTSYELMHL